MKKITLVTGQNGYFLQNPFMEKSVVHEIFNKQDILL